MNAILKMIVVALSVCLFPVCVFAQTDDKTIMSIGQKDYSVEEFSRYCSKNSIADINECLEEFKIYNLKLLEAETMQIDKTPAFEKEISKLRNDVVSPYLESLIPDERLIEQEYGRLNKNYVISSVYIPFASGSRKNELLEADTLAAYQKALELYNKCVFDNYFEKSKDAEGKSLQFLATERDVFPLALPLMLENVIYSMNKGEISKPVRARRGYYIFKILDEKEIDTAKVSYETIKPIIISNLEKSEDAFLMKIKSLERLKAQNDFKVNEKAYLKLKNCASRIYVLSEAFKNKFENDNETLFSSMGRAFSIADFIKFLGIYNKTHEMVSGYILNEKLFEFEYTMLSEIEGSLIEERFPELAVILNDLRNDLLVISVTENVNLKKMTNDIAGLVQFFEENKDRYKWDAPRYKGVVVHAKTVALRTQIKNETEGMEPDSAIVFLRDKYILNEKEPQIKIGKMGIYRQGSDEYVDELIFETGKGVPYLEFPRYFVIGRLAEQPESYMDVYSFVLNDYQKHREDKWFDSLKKKYPVRLNIKPDKL